MSSIPAYSLKSIYKEISDSLSLSFPLIISRIVYAATPFVTTVFAARLGEDSLAAVALGSQLFIMIWMFLIGLFSSVSVLVSHCYGAEDYRDAGSVVSQGFLLALAVTLPVIIIFYFSAYGFFWMKLNPFVVHLAILYFHAALLSILPLQLLETLNRFLIGIGRTRFVLLISILQVPIEIYLMAVFVFGKFGLPKFGIVGLAYGYIATFSLAVLLIGAALYFSPVGKAYFSSKTFFLFNRKLMCDLLKIGFPIGLMSTVEALVLLALITMVGWINENALAAYQITWQYYVMFLMVVIGLAEGTAIRVGHEAGRRNWPAIKLASSVNLGLSLSFALFCVIGFSIFSNPMVALDIDIYNPKFEVLFHYTKVFLTLAGILLLVENFRNIVLGALRGLKDTKLPMIISTSGLGGLGIFSAYLFAFKLHLGGQGIWLGLILGCAVPAFMLLHRLYCLLQSR